MIMLVILAILAVAWTLWFDTRTDKELEEMGVRRGNNGI